MPERHQVQGVWLVVTQLFLLVLKPLRVGLSSLYHAIRHMPGSCHHMASMAELRLLKEQRVVATKTSRAMLLSLNTAIQVLVSLGVPEATTEGLRQAQHQR